MVGAGRRRAAARVFSPSARNRDKVVLARRTSSSLYGSQGIEGHWGHCAAEKYSICRVYRPAGPVPAGQLAIQAAQPPPRARRESAEAGGPTPSSGCKHQQQAPRKVGMSGQGGMGMTTLLPGPRCTRFTEQERGLQCPTWPNHLLHEVATAIAVTSTLLAGRPCHRVGFAHLLGRSARIRRRMRPPYTESAQHDKHKVLSCTNDLGERPPPRTSHPGVAPSPAQNPDSMNRTREAVTSFPTHPLA